MTQQQTIEKILNELRSKWYIISIFEKVIVYYLNLVYSIGFNEGMSHRNEHRRFAIDQYTKSGEKIDHHNSIKEASEKTGFDMSNISKAVRGEYQTSHGYYWKRSELGY